MNNNLVFLSDKECDNNKILFNATIKDAVEILENGKLKIVLVIDENNVLKGTVYDGDIRRALLKGLSLSCSIDKVMTSNYIKVSKQVSYKEVKEKMQKNSIFHVPVTNEQDKLLGLHVLDNHGFEKDSKIYPNSVLLMAGGRGERLMPLTENCPKPLIRINGKPLLEIILEQCMKAGLRNFYISVHYLSDQIISYFGNGEKWDISISYLHEEKPMGTAGALSLLPKKINHPILIMNGDILTKINIPQFIEFHKNNFADITIAGSEHYYTSPYGVVEVDGINFKSIVEKPTFKNFINAGIYIINPEIIKCLNDKEYLDMPDLLNKRLGGNYKKVVYPIHEYWLDIGRIESLNKAKVEWEL